MLFHDREVKYELIVFLMQSQRDLGRLRSHIKYYDWAESVINWQEIFGSKN